MSVEDNLKALRRYRSYGLWGGLFFGTMVGIVIGGPQFREWENPVSTWATMIASCAAVGAIVGFFFLGLVPQSTGTGFYDAGSGSGVDSGGSDSGGSDSGGGDGASSG